jgi:hypothetical protein
VASEDIYVQVTASQGSAGKSRSVFVLVPAKIRQSFRETSQVKPDEENAIARKLAEAFAKYAFTHRTIFDHYEVSYAFYEHEPSEIKGRPPQLTQDGLQAWIV